MNSFRFRTVLFLLPAFLLLASCSKKKSAAEEAARNLSSHIAPDMIYSISAKTFLDKSGISDGSAVPKAFNLMMGEQLSYLTDESKTGIRFDGKSFVFFNFDKSTRNSGSGIIVFGIKNADTFSKLVSEGTDLKPTEKNGYKYISSPGGEMAVSWRKTYGLLFFAEDSDLTKSELEDHIGKLMEYTESKGDKENEAYTAFFESDTDISAIFNFEALGKTQEPGFEAAQWVSDAYKGAYFLHTVHFDTDKITSHNRIFSSDKSKNTPELLAKNGISADYLTFLSKYEAPIGFITAAVSVKEMQQLLEKTGGREWERETRRVSENYGLSMDELIGGLSGEVAVSFTGIEQLEYPYTWINDDGEEEEETWYNNEPVFALTLGLSNDYLPSVFDSVPDVKKKENYYQMYDLFVAFTEKKMFISTDKLLVSTVATKGSLAAFKEGRKGIEEQALKHPVFGYFDFTWLYRFLQTESPDVAAFFADFDYASGSGNGEETTVELHFKNTGKNSLFIITSAIFKMWTTETVHHSVEKIEM